jgi:hypothetical protein
MKLYQVYDNVWHKNYDNCVNNSLVNSLVASFYGISKYVANVVNHPFKLNLLAYLAFLFYI